MYPTRPYRQPPHNQPQRQRELRRFPLNGQYYTESEWNEEWNRLEQKRKEEEKKRQEEPRDEALWAKIEKEEQERAVRMAEDTKRRNAIIEAMFAKEDEEPKEEEVEEVNEEIQEEQVEEVTEEEEDEEVEDEEEVEEQEATPEVSVPQDPKPTLQESVYQPKPSVIKGIEEPPKQVLPTTSSYRDALLKPLKPKQRSMSNEKVKPPKPRHRIKLRSPEIPRAARVKKRWPTSRGEDKGSYNTSRGGKKNWRGRKKLKGASRSRSGVCWIPGKDPGKRERATPMYVNGIVDVRTVRTKRE